MRRLIVLLVCTTGLTLSCTPEVTNVVIVNNQREDKNLPPLEIRDELGAKAKEQAAVIARSCSLSHSTLSEGQDQGWSKLGENVAMRGDVVKLEEALMDSPSHRANILNSGFDSIGTEFSESCGGILVQEFRG